MLNVDSLKLLPVWLNPEHLLSTARIIMQGHGLKAIAVMDDGRLVGLLSTESIAGQSDSERVGDRMEPVVATIPASTPIRQVAEMFVEMGIDRAPVMRGDEYLGLVTATMLLKELGRSWDPLTGLSWSDELRQWGIENLREGREIVVLFIDLNDFGEYNKRYGHIVGDKVLRRVADLLRGAMPADKGVLVRYGGDEFAIGMSATQDEGRTVAEMLRRRMQEIIVPEAQEPVTYCVGMSGGKRTKERENVHFAATLDNLINLASRDCILQKREKAPAMPLTHDPEPPSPAEQQAGEKLPAKSKLISVPPVKVLSVYAEENSPMSLTQVVVSVGEGVVSGVNARMGKSVIESVAVATGKALERAFPGTALELETVNLSEGPGGERLVTVSGHIKNGKGGMPVGGVHPVERDLYTSVAQATLEAYLSAVRSSG